MRVQSIWAAIEPRDPACNRFFGPAVQMPLRKVDRIAEFHDLAQKVGTMTETLQNAWHLLAAGFGAPLVVNLGYFPRCIAVFDELDLGFVVRHCLVHLAAN